MSAVVCARDGLYVNLFLPGRVKTLTPAGRALGLAVGTCYPAGGTVRFVVSPEEPETFTLGVRIPAWSEKTGLAVNGEPVAVQPGEYARLTREWRPGDSVLLTLDMRVMPIRPEDYGVSSADAPFMALRRGPVVLARDARLGRDVDAPVQPSLRPDGSARAYPGSEAPFPSQAALAVRLMDGSFMPMVDYASAGKTWQEDSRMCAWFPVK